MATFYNSVVCAVRPAGRDRVGNLFLFVDYGRPHPVSGKPWGVIVPVASVTWSTAAERDDWLWEHVWADEAAAELAALNEADEDLAAAAADRSVPVTSGTRPGRILASVVDERVARLKAVRKQLAVANACPAYTVATNAVLLEIAKTSCATVAELATVPGFGAKRAARWGAMLLAVL